MKLILKMAVCGLAVFGLSSCNSLYDDLQPCEPPAASINLTFTMNMDFQDLFNRDVHCVDLYVFKKGGTLAGEYHAENTKSTRAVASTIYLQLEPGVYEAVVYGGMSCSLSSFDKLFAENSSLTKKDLEVALNTSFYFDNSDETGDPQEHLADHSALQIHDHFYGSIDEFSIGEIGSTPVTIDLTRNTNVIYVNMKNKDNTDIDINDYRVYIVDDNNTMDDTNDLTQSGLIAYRPYDKTNFVDSNNIPWAKSSFTVSRLHTSNDPELVVINKEIGDSKPTLSGLNLMPYIMEAKAQLAPSMDDQEFLDRQYEWTVDVTLDVVNSTWVSITVKVNDWEVRFDNIEFNN